MTDAGRAPRASGQPPEGPAQHQRNARDGSYRGQQRPGAHRGPHRWMMIACCIPMVVLAIALVASGTANAGALVIALLCTLAMALMLGGLGGSGGPHGQ